jgi:hypothetical protein
MMEVTPLVLDAQSERARRDLVRHNEKPEWVPLARNPPGVAV